MEHYIVQELNVLLAKEAEWTLENKFLDKKFLTKVKLRKNIIQRTMDSRSQSMSG